PKLPRANTVAPGGTEWATGWATGWARTGGRQGPLIFLYSGRSRLAWVELAGATTRGEVGGSQRQPRCGPVGSHVGGASDCSRLPGSGKRALWRQPRSGRRCTTRSPRSGTNVADGLVPTLVGVT